jgi:hypothetical protein
MPEAQPEQLQRDCYTAHIRRIEHADQLHWLPWVVTGYGDHNRIAVCRNPAARAAEGAFATATAVS